jgi:hypothetical protein
MHSYSLRSLSAKRASTVVRHIYNLRPRPTIRCAEGGGHGQGEQKAPEKKQQQQFTGYTEYMAIIRGSPSFRRRWKMTQSLLLKYFGHKHQKNIELFMDAYTQQLIPPGLKAHVAGESFNQQVKTVLEDELGDDDEYQLCFEACPYPKVLAMYGLERPDWCLTWKNHCVVGYNQIDIWSGGAQTNRGAKYILNDSLHEGSNSCPISVHLIYFPFK